MTDNTLSADTLARISQGDTQAFAELVMRFQQPLFGFLGRLGMGPAQAQDVAQETFLRVWLHRQQFDPTRAQWSTWLFTIARNLALDTLQAQARQPQGVGDELPEPASTAPGPAQTLAHKQAQQQLQNALRQLPLPDRSALALVYVHGLSLEDVARIEGDGLAAIKTRLHRARHKLRTLLQDGDTLQSGLKER